MRKTGGTDTAFLPAGIPVSRKDPLKSDKNAYPIGETVCMSLHRPVLSVGVNVRCDTTTLILFSQSFFLIDLLFLKAKNLTQAKSFPTCLKKCRIEPFSFVLCHFTFLLKFVVTLLCVCLDQKELRWSTGVFSQTFPFNSNRRQKTVLQYICKSAQPKPSQSINYPRFSYRKVRKDQTHIC